MGDLDSDRQHRMEDFTLTRYIFVNCIANGDIDWKSPLTAAHQPSIRDCHMIVQGDDNGPQIIEELAGTDGATLARYSERIAEGRIVVGHSVEYHHGHLRATMIPMGIAPHDGRVRTICTMLGLNGYVVKRNGKKGWPTFGEACEHFGITRATPETAEDNARCLKLVFEGMLRIRDMPEAKVWKER